MSVTWRMFDVAPSRLFETLINPETYPRWLVGAKRIRKVSPDWPQPGSFFKHVVGVGPLAIPDRTTVRAIEEPRLLVLFVRARPLIEAVVRFEVTATGEGCELVMTEEPAGFYKLASPLAQPLIKARNERSLQNLQDVIESSPAGRPTP